MNAANIHFKKTNTTTKNPARRNQGNIRIKSAIGALKSRLSQMIPASFYLRPAKPSTNLKGAYSAASNTDSYMYFAAKRKYGLLERMIHILENSACAQNQYNMALAIA